MAVGWSAVEWVVAGAPAVVELGGTGREREHGLTIGPLPLNGLDPGERDDVGVIAVSEDQRVPDLRLALPLPEPKSQMPIVGGFEAADVDVGPDLPIPDSHDFFLSL